jgi:phosphatidate cytidylyltransferase
MTDPADKSSRKLSDLGLRFASALVLGPFVLLVTYLGGTAFTALMLAATGLFLWEWYSITGTAVKSASALVGFAALAVLCGFHVLGQVDIGLAAMLLGALAAYVVSGFSRSGRWALEGILYSGLALYALLALRSGSRA